MWTQLTTPGFRIVVVALGLSRILTGIGPDKLAPEGPVMTIEAATTANVTEYIAFGLILP
jgi:hypothetical protein